MKPFTNEQKFYVEEGRILAKALKDEVEQAVNPSKNRVEPKQDYYFSSAPGVGKSFTVRAALMKHAKNPVMIEGSASMNAIVIKLAVAVHTLKKNETRTVWIDDCDTMFMDNDWLNVMKGVFDPDRRVLGWHKNMTMQIAKFEKSEHPDDLLKAEALRSFQSAEAVGVEIPTDQLRFIITSNKSLTAPNAVRNTVKKQNEAAIRDRLNYKDWDLSKGEQWGWTAAVALDNNILGLNKEQKQILLDWMWVNWERLPSTSLRAVNDLAAAMINEPEDYPNIWKRTLGRIAA